MTIEAFTYSYVQMAQAENESTAKLQKYNGSWMVALAVVLGKIADKMTDNLLNLAQKLDKLQEDKAGMKAGDKPPKADNGMSENELTAHMQAQTQLLNMFMQAMNTIIKTVGEANKDVARKQ